MNSFKTRLMKQLATIAVCIVSSTIVGAAQGPPPGAPANSTPPGGLPPGSQYNAPASVHAPVQTPPATPQQILPSINGSVPEGTATNSVLLLSLDEAIARGLRNNLAGLLASSASDQARAQHLATVAALLPQVSATATESREKLNLAVFGITVPNVPPIVGPFDIFTAQLAANVPVLNLTAINANRATNSVMNATQHGYAAMRDLVVLAITNQYLLTVADESRVDTAQSQLTTAEQELNNAQDAMKAGTINGLDLVRAQVQRNYMQQQSVGAQNELSKQRLQLARAIGLPTGQDFSLTDSVPYVPFASMDPNAAVVQALSTRADYRAAQDVEHAAEFQLAATKDARLPSLSLNGDYGPVGHEITSNHPIFSVGAALTMPIFEGGMFSANILAAQSQLRDSKNKLANLRAEIDQQVRSALLDVQTNAALVQSTRDARDLAQQELTLARDRFHAGVADNLEEVQAEQQVAGAEENYIRSLYAYDLAKTSLAQAIGVAESSYRQYLLAQ